ncbi:UDP-glucose dehydrogenase family protein [Brevibacillus centrosporus]|uniref:UDP-glucose 6-dehydrogenase n=1 Tax=Brevibacillus centrosporus TaxID=54910 RepID=A0A1I3VTG7_9BACL|nr:UDP-glucose/GDP-mannose dehydrogenase family protein [Brevibacillus centrosporus]MED4908166.1 UDP-glucose/GDP-mannose dehydrogenase family protein [Brevibacillus centrosporus]SFJ97577.1 UDPglucose 6-dehydrogenase [Brevibacillus centrosporus]
MRIAIVGTGYVGLVTGVCLAKIGHQVTCVDVDEDKIAQLSSGEVPFYEPGLGEMLDQQRKEKRIAFTVNPGAAFANAEAIFIAVGTPQGIDGMPDLQALITVAQTIGRNVQHDVIVVIKSTVPIGTNTFLSQIIAEHLAHPVSVRVASNPEFLREGSAVYDTFHGDRIVIGTDDAEVAEMLAAMYEPLHIPILHTDIRSAEMIKYASNAFLATKISFINEIANLCESLGATIEDVARGMGMDQRIGEKFLRAGIGYGGSCFPKDVKALLGMAELSGDQLQILQAVERVNRKQQMRLVEKAVSRFGDLRGKRMALLGLSFKPDTDDMREAPSLGIAAALLEHGAQVVGYDPVSMNNARTYLPAQVELFESAEQALAGADAAFVLTEWQEFTLPAFVPKLRAMREAIVFDGRNCLHDSVLEDDAVEYHPIGRQLGKKLVTTSFHEKGRER